MNIIVKTLIKRPGTILLSFGILFIISFFMTGMLSFEQDVFKALPLKNPVFKVLIHAMRTSAAQNRLYILVRPVDDDSQNLIEVGKDVAAALRLIRIDNKSAFSRVTLLKAEAVGAGDFEEMLVRYLMQPESFITKEDTGRLKTLLTSRDMLETELRKSLALIALPGASGFSRIAAMDPLNFRQFMIEKLQTMHHGLSFAPGPYLLSPSGDALLIVATPAVSPKNHSASRLLLKKIDEIRTACPKLKIGLTGGYAVAAQEEALVRGDILVCIIGSVFGIAALFFLAYRNFLTVVFLLLPLGAGLQLAMGVTALMTDHVHMLAAAFSTVILGLGIDFAIHIYDRYKMEREAGMPAEQSVENAIIGTGSAVLAGGITTLIAFLVLIFTGNPILYQIGLLVSLGLIFCLITILWALPAWLIFIERFSWGRSQRPMRLIGMDRMGRFVNRRPVFVLCLALLFFTAALPGLLKVGFERDIMSVKPRGLEAIDVQQDLFRAFGAGKEYVLIVWKADNEKMLFKKGEKVDNVLKKCRQEGIIHSWTSASSISSFAPFLIEGVDLESIKRLFSGYGLELKDFEYTNEFLNAVSNVNRSGQSFKEEGKSTKVCRLPITGMDRFPEIFGRFFINGENNVEGVAWALLPGQEKISLLKAALTETLPNLIIVNPQLAAHYLLDEIRSELIFTAGCAGLLVLIIIIIFFRRLSALFLVPLPMVMGIITMAGVMGLLGIKINLFNFIVLPILIGIGLDDGIHIYRRNQELNDIEKTLSSTGRSILLTTLTTICGFGSLSFARYHVLKEMGLMVIVGVVSSFIFSIMVLPAILKLRGSIKKGNCSATDPR
ncbi:MAG: MMPL family transporter [Deltaproteobacteria bacterium]|nr:MMPL family transporter [Deltaproteobacteria bacterium]